MLRRLSSVLSSALPSEVRILLDGYRLRAAGHPGVGNPLSLLEVSPHEIEWHISSSDLAEKFPKTIVIAGGDWDRKCIPFEDNTVYQAFVEHFDNNVPWEDVTGFDSVFKNHDEWRDEATSYDDLYRDLKENGYKTQAELSPLGAIRHPVVEEIQVYIGRDGRFIEMHGQHRLALAKILDLESVPVWVNVRHADWQAVRDHVSEAETVADELRPLLSHPDLQSVL